MRAAQKEIESMLSEISACTDFPEEVDEGEAAQNLLGRVEALLSEMERRADPDAAGASPTGPRWSCAAGPTWARAR